MLKRLLRIATFYLTSSSNKESEYIMGKYQLDYKGMQQVERFHEKQSQQNGSRKDKMKELKAQFLEKAKKHSSQK